MATWEYTDPQGRVFEFDRPGDTAPTEGELKLYVAAFDKANPEEVNNPLLSLVGKNVENAGAALTKGQQFARTISPYARTALELGGMTGGGIVGAGAGSLSINPVVAGAAMLGGAGGGYAIGSGVADVIDEYAGLKKPPTLAEGAQRTAENVVTGAAMQAGGDVAGPILSATSKGIGKVIKPVLGKLTGTGTGSIDEAIKAGTSTGFGTKAPFDQALRGNVTGDEVVDTARNALRAVKEQRGATYQGHLENISKDMGDIDTQPITEKAIELMKRYRIKMQIDPEKGIVFDTSRSTLGDGADDAVKALKKLMDWGTQSGDKTPVGLDALKRYLGDLYSESSNARQFVTSLKDTVHKTITDVVPEYKDMTKGYDEMTGIIQDIESALSMKKQGLSGRITADQTLRRLMSSMKDNFALRKDLVDTLGTKGGEDIAGLAAGYAMRSPVPVGLAWHAPGIAGLGALAHFVNPAFYPVLAASSPRLSAEFLRLFGKAVFETKGLVGPAVKSGGILLRDSLKEPDNQSPPSVFNTGKMGLTSQY